MRVFNKFRVIGKLCVFSLQLQKWQTVNSRHFRVYIIQACYRREVLLLPTKYFSKKSHRTVLKRREEKLVKYSKCDKFVFTELLQSKYDAAIP